MEHTWSEYHHPCSWHGMGKKNNGDGLIKNIFLVHRFQIRYINEDEDNGDALSK